MAEWVVSQRMPYYGLPLPPLTMAYLETKKSGQPPARVTKLAGPTAYIMLPHIMGVASGLSTALLLLDTLLGREHSPAALMLEGKREDGPSRYVYEADGKVFYLVRPAGR